MKIFVRMFSACIITLACTVAFADDYSSTFTSCVKASGGVTDALASCYRAESKSQDTRLNSNYKKAVNTLPAQQKQKLQDAQRLWIKFRDADCGMYYSLTGGTMDLLNGADCELSTTKKRADDLAWIAENGAE